MKQAETTSGTSKEVILPGTVSKPESSWAKSAKREDTPAPAPAPVWTRYIDSRLKQFCAR